MKHLSSMNNEKKINPTVVELKLLRYFILYHPKIRCHKLGLWLGSSHHDPLPR